MQINTIELIAKKALDASDSGHFLPETQAQILSPCVGQCGLVPARTHCAGCLRTLDEIQVWSSASTPVRQLIWRKVLARAGLAQPVVLAVDGVVSTRDALHTELA